MKNISAETAEALEKFSTNIDRRIPTIACYLLLMLILREGFSIPFPYITFGLVSFMVLSSLLLAFYFENFTPGAKTIINGFFLYMAFDLFILTIVIYFLGGVSWIGFIFYSFYAILNFMTFPRGHALFLTAWIIALYLGLVFFQYFQILPFFSLFPLETQTHFNFFYVLTTTITFVSTAVLVAYFSEGFYQMYAAKIRALKKIHNILEREKGSLEIRVETRKKEIIAERKSLEEKIEERKRGLEERRRELEEKAEELEKFQKVVLGRESKVIELKKELGQLKKN